MIGGKLTFLEGSEVEGLNVDPVQMENVPESTATTVAALKDTVNELLSALKEAGYMEPDEPEQEDDDDDDGEDDDNGGTPFDPNR